MRTDTLTRKFQMHFYCELRHRRSRTPVDKLIAGMPLTRIGLCFCLLCLSIGVLFGEEINPPAVSEKGPEVAASVHGVSDRKRPLVTGNGDLGVVWMGGPGKFNLGLGKNDFWGVVRGSICTVGNQSISCSDMKFASAQMEQNVGPATITGKFEERKKGTGLSLESWVAYPENVVVTRLENNGTKPLSFETEIADGYGGGLPTLVGSSSDSTWLQVSPDTVPFEVGNRICKLPGPNRTTIKAMKPFVGRIAGLTLAELGSEKPYLPWEPEARYVENIGRLTFHREDSHGISVELNGDADHRLVMSSGCVPQKGFTLSVWVNATKILDDGTIFSAIAVESPKSYPFLKGMLLHVVGGKLETRLNFTTIIDPQPLPLHRWVEVRVVYEIENLALYVDGKKVASAGFPEAPDQNGWDKTALHLGDPKLPFQGCAPLGVLRQRVLAAGVQASGRVLRFTVAPRAHALVLLAVVSDRNAKDYLKQGEDLLALDEAGIATLREKHLAWWNSFWGKSFVRIPDKKIEDNWYGSLYLLACCSRPDTPPPGLWHTFVTRMGASWDGDYTLNYNYQAPFWAAYVSNHFELADSYETVLLDHMERGRSIAKNAWRISPVAQPRSLEAALALRSQVKPDPNTADYRGIYLYTHLIPMPGWSDDYGTFWNQKSNALFCTVNMIQRWRLSRDLDYARKVYPFLLATAEFWDHYLVLQNGRYVSLNDALAENSGDNTNPATTLSFLRLLYPDLIEISTRLNVDQDRRAKWREILVKLSPLMIVPASSVRELQKLGPEAVKDRIVIRDCEVGPGFPTSPFLLYKDRQKRDTSAGMNCTQVIFPGWSIGMESSPQERKAALDTVTLAAQWYDNNNDCTFYPCAAAVGYDPKEILENLDALIDTAQEPNFMFKTHGGGTEDDAIVPCCLAYMFLQSYQENIHLFPNWPMDQDASFGNLNVCGGFLIGSAVKQGRIPYVQVVSQAGEECRLVNPWPGHSVSLQGEDQQRTLQGNVLKFPTRKGQSYILRSGA
jgi:hypothetical protein